MNKLVTLLLFLLVINGHASAQIFRENWAKTAGGTGNDQGTAIALDLYGGVYIAGNFSSPTFTIGTNTLTNNGGSDVFIAKYDTAGNFLWAQQFGGAGNETVKSIAVAPDGSIFLTDTFSASINLGAYSLNSAGMKDIYLAKLNSVGSLQWVKQIGSASDQTIPDVVTDSRSFVYVSGQGNNSLMIDGIPVAAGDCFIVKIAPNGDVRKIKSISTAGWLQTDELFNIAIDQQDNLHTSYFYGLENGGNGTPVIPGPSYQSRSVFDSSGALLVEESISRVGTIAQNRLFGSSYHTRKIDDYTLSSRFISSSPELDGNIKLQGRISGTPVVTDFANSLYTRCFGSTYKPVVNADKDFSGNVFMAGNYQYAYCLSPTDPVLFKFNTSLQLTSSNGRDIYVMAAGYTGGASSLYVTKDNGNTSESANNMVLDPSGKAIYIIGDWSKVVDTSQFRFGNSTLANTGAINTPDALFLKLSYSGNSIKANAGMDRTICSGGSASLSGSASGGTGSFSYSWTGSGLNNPNIPNPIVQPSATTDYVLKVTDNLGNIATDTIKVIIDSNIYRPTISLNTGSINPFCEGDYIELISSSATSYQWSTGSINSFLVVNSSDTVTVTARRSDGCVGVSLPFIATMKPRTETPMISPAGLVSVCTTYATLKAENTESPVTYDWSTGETTDSITVVSPGVYSVIAMGSSGCASLPASKTIVGQPSGFITTSGNQTICNGDSVLLTLHTAVGNTILWSNGDTTASIWVKNADDYTARMTTPEGCTDVAQNDVIIDVITPPAKPVVLASGPLSFCEGGDVGLKVDNADPYLFYEWSTGDYTDNIQVVDGGIYTVKAMDIFGCASDTASVLVSENPYPYGTIFSNSGTSICEGDSIKLTVNSVGGATYAWNNGSSGNSIWVKTAGNYKAFITSAEGCSDSTSNSVSITVKPLPVPVITQTGNSLHVSPAAQSYQWYMNGGAVSGGIASDLDIKQGGNYQVQVYVNGCIASTGTKVILRHIIAGGSYQVFPNPVVNEMNIIYSLEQDVKVDVSVYDVTGKKTYHVVRNEFQQAGDHNYRISNASNFLHKGVYFVVFDFGGNKAVQQIVVL